jgi:hypothetical protein
MCALWRVQSPFDVKDFWGRKEPPPYDYPRAPIIGYNGIAAVKGEQGTFLGDDLVNTASEERFLDLSGWKDASGMGDSTVTATSKNTYSNRSAVATRYDASGDLADSKYWYHVEMFEELRLRRLLSGVRAPNLVKVLDDLKGNPPKEIGLLCYYFFFFPAHEEGPIPGCTNVEAREFGSFAGEWACMALLLEKDGSAAPFKPSYIGMSGRGPYAATPPRGQAADSDDMARRSVMMVFPFATSESIGEHPKIFVANGTHSLYPMAGTYAWRMEPTPRANAASSSPLPRRTTQARSRHQASFWQSFLPPPRPGRFSASLLWPAPLWPLGWKVSCLLMA